MEKKIVVNPQDWEDKFWKFDWKITYTFGEFYANADNEQEAMDYLIDWCEDKAPGLISCYEELDEGEKEDYVYGGNSGVYFNDSNIIITKLKGR